MCESKEIYLVTSGAYSDHCVEAIFSEESDANVYADELKKNNRQYVDVEPWPIDEKRGWVASKCYNAALRLSDGRVYKEFVTTEMAPMNSRGKRSSVDEDYDWVEAESYVSAEHALKMAVEKRQEWLREKALSGGTIE